MLSKKKFIKSSILWIYYEMFDKLANGVSNKYTKCYELFVICTKKLCKYNIIGFVINSKTSWLKILLLHRYSSYDG